MIKSGDRVTRMIGQGVPMDLKVSEVTDTEIICGPWKFCKVTGAEIDDDMGWGAPPLPTGSYLEME